MASTTWMGSRRILKQRIASMTVSLAQLDISAHVILAIGTQSPALLAISAQLAPDIRRPVRLAATARAQDQTSILMTARRGNSVQPGPSSPKNVTVTCTIAPITVWNVHQESGRAFRNARHVRRATFVMARRLRNIQSTERKRMVMSAH